MIIHLISQGGKNGKDVLFILNNGWSGLIWNSWRGLVWSGVVWSDTISRMIWFQQDLMSICMHKCVYIIAKMYDVTPAFKTHTHDVKE